VITTGVNGRWLLTTSQDSGGVSSDGQKCLDWYAKEKADLLNIMTTSFSTPQCPCDLFGMFIDRRFGYDRDTSIRHVKACFYSRLPTGHSAKVSF